MVLPTQAFRPRDGAQQRRLEDLIIIYGSASEVLRTAVDVLHEQQEQKIEELRPQFEAAQAAQAALNEARQALQE